MAVTARQLLNVAASANLVAGAGTAKLGPVQNERWLITTLAIIVSGSVKVPACQLYLGPNVAPAYFLDGTVNGNLNSTSRAAGFPLITGQFLFAVWSGADTVAGVTGTLSVFGFRELGTGLDLIH